MILKNRYAYRMLSLLIKKYEAGKSFKSGGHGKQRPQFAMAGSPLAGEYFDEMDHRKRELIHEALEELVSRDMVEVAWPKFEEGRRVEKVYLNFNAITQAYRILGLIPKSDRMETFRQTLGPLLDHPWAWVQNWWSEVDAALAQRKTAGLDLGDLTGLRELVAVLLALPDIEDSMPRRIFSQRVLGDSKAFEQRVEKRLLSLIKRYGSEEYETDEEYLDSLGLFANPKLVIFSGQFSFQVDRVPTQTGNLPGGVGLSIDTVKVMQIIDLPVREILLIENLTTYHQVVKTNNGATSRLVIYTGGFPHRGIQLFLTRLKEGLETMNVNVPGILHWGDMDYGGMRIFEYIRQNYFSGLQPLLMDVSTYERYLHLGISFSSEYAGKLARLAGNPAYAGWRPLIEAMLKHGKIIEQESIEPGL